MKYLILVLCSLLSSAHGAGFEEKVTIQAEWNSANHPGIFFPQYEAHFSSMKSKQSLQRNYWSDDYWPRDMGGIAYRWMTDETPSEYPILSRSRARKLSGQQIESLSPAEKWDLLNNNYNFDFTKKIKRQNPSSAPSWHGICHGWAEANLHHKTPTAKTFKNKLGLTIPFYASDIAGLLSYYYAKERRGKVYFLGRRCRGSNPNDMRCQDVNPGALHIVLNESFKRGRGIVADVDPMSAVWNHPLKSYSYQVLEQRNPHPESAKGTVREIKIRNTISYATEVSSSKLPIQEFLTEMELLYWLELDDQGNILGGSWVEGPAFDFLWYRNFRKLPDDFAGLLK